MYRDLLVSDFKSPEFQTAFRQYFEELSLNVKDWDGLFEEMNNDNHGKNFAHVRVSESGQVIGFIQFTVMEMSSWFFRTQMGFVREFWIASEYRKNGHGTELLIMTEKYFRKKDVGYVVLTTNTAEKFYLKQGYEKNVNFSAKNGDPVYLKKL